MSTQNRYLKIGAATILLVIVVVVALALSGGLFNRPMGTRVTSPGDTGKLVLVKSPSASNGSTQTAVVVYDYTFKPLPHAKGVIIDGGFPPGSTPDEKKAIVAKAAARDPFVLWYFLTRVYGLENVPTQYELVDQKLRIEWHKKLLVLLDASDFAKFSLTGMTFYNEGHSTGGVVTASVTTFGGGVEATKITIGGHTTIVKNNCVNRQMVTKPVGTVPLPPSKEGVPCPKRRNPNATQPVQSNPPCLVQPTPRYNRGNAEQVVQDQNSQPKGGTCPTPHGTPGTGNPGGHTPTGSDNGQSAPPPSCDPPAPDAKGETPNCPVPSD